MRQTQSRAHVSLTSQHRLHGFLRDRRLGTLPVHICVFRVSRAWRLSFSWARLLYLVFARDVLVLGLWAHRGRVVPAWARLAPVVVVSCRLGSQVLNGLRVFSSVPKPFLWAHLGAVSLRAASFPYLLISSSPHFLVSSSSHPLIVSSPHRLIPSSFHPLIVSSLPFPSPPPPPGLALLGSSRHLHILSRSPWLPAQCSATRTTPRSAPN